MFGAPAKIYRRNFSGREALLVLDRDGRTPLFAYCVDRDETALERAIQQGEDVNIRDNHGETALHMAARHYALACAKLLIEAGAAVDATDNHGNTPLCRAVFDGKGRGEMVELLLSAGADPDMRNHHGVSPRSLALSIANYDMSQFFKSST